MSYPRYDQLTIMWQKSLQCHGEPSTQLYPCSSVVCYASVGHSLTLSLCPMRPAGCWLLHVPGRVRATFRLTDEAITRLVSYWLLPGVKCRKRE